MTFPKARLAVSACLFVGWLAFLLYLVIESRTVVLSNPQFMVAQAYAVVDVDEGRGMITEILWSTDPADEKLVGQVIELAGLAHQRGQRLLVPLQKTASGLEIAAVPRSSAFRQLPPTHGTVESFGIFSHRVFRRLPLAQAIEQRDQLKEAGYKVFLEEEELRIYPATADTRAQVDKIVAARKKR